MDMSFMSKFVVQGRDAGKVLNRLSTANVDGNLNEITYTQWLNPDGKMEADLTVSKQADDRFFVVATDTMHRHVETMMRNEIEASSSFATVTDVTGGLCQLNIQGPNSRKLMQLLTDTDMSNEAFPFRSVQQIAIGYALVTCVRITYLGELGYELYIPTEHAMHVYDKIVEVGERDTGLVHAGLKALASLRMEKGYRDFGHDMDNTDTILNVGLGFTCDFDKPHGFIGKEAVLAEKEKGIPHKRLVQVLVKDPEPFMFHGEVVYCNGERIGDVRAASYSHTLGGALGLAMLERPDGKSLTNKFIDANTWQVEIGNQKFAADVSLKPMYDPSNERIKS